MAIRGQQSEPLELHPGASVREAARIVELEKWAWGRARALKIFYSHLAAYVVINFVLFLIDSTSPGPAWFYAPLVGWGLVLGLHALHAFELLPWPTQDWEKRKVRELVNEKLRH